MPLCARCFHRMPFSFTKLNSTGTGYWLLVTEYWFKVQKKTTCPTMLPKEVQPYAQQRIETWIDELEILCIKQGVACLWVEELSSLQAHFESNSGCGYIEVQYSNKCGVKMMCKELEAHLAQQCPLCKMKCQYCYYEDTYTMIHCQYHCAEGQRLPQHHTEEQRQIPSGNCAPLWAPAWTQNQYHIMIIT